MDATYSCQGGYAVKLLSSSLGQLMCGCTTLEELPIVGDVESLHRWSNFRVARWEDRRVLVVGERALGGGACCSSKTEVRKGSEKKPADLRSRNQEEVIQNRQAAAKQESAAKPEEQEVIQVSQPKVKQESAIRIEEPPIEVEKVVIEVPVQRVEVEAGRNVKYYRSLLKDMQDEDSSTGDAYFYMGQAYMEDDNFNKAAESLATAREIYEREHGKDFYWNAVILELMGDISKTEDDKESAYSSYKRAIRIIRKSEGDKVPEVPRILHKMGEIQESLKDNDEAFKCYEEEVEVLGNTDDSAKGIALFAMAMIKYREKDKKAKKLLQQARAKMLHTEKSKEKGEASYRLASLLEKEDNLEDARDLYLESLKNYPDGEAKSKSKAFKMAGSLLKKTGNPEKAIEYYQEALHTYENIYEPPHQDIAHTLYCIGLTFDKNEEPKQALKRFEQSLEMSRELKWEQLVLDNLNMLGSVHNKLGEYESAADYFSKVIEMQKEDEIARAYYNIGVVYEEMKDFETAKKYYQLGLDSPNEKDLRAHLFNNMGVCYDAGNQLETAKEYYEKALTVQKEMMEESTPDLAKIYSNLGVLFFKRGHYDDALAKFERSLGIYQRYNSNDDVEKAKIAIGTVYMSKNELDKANEIIRDVEKPTRLPN